jgi:SAM-dependent methyltransferase
VRRSFVDRRWRVSSEAAKQESPYSAQDLQILILDAITAHESLRPFQDLLVCPGCRSDLSYQEEVLHCTGCEADYRLVEGIPLFEMSGESADFALQSEAGQSYQYKFAHDRSPQLYDEQFLVETHKKTRTEREIKLLSDLLSSLLTEVESIEAVLNIPCGGGRLSQPLARACSKLIEADVALPQVRFARDHGDYSGVGQMFWMTSSAFHLPCIDDGFDGVVCARLIHHFDDPSDHRRLLAELCRVAKKFVIVSFNDSFSVKAISRKLRGRPNLHTLSTRMVDEMARPHGFTLKTAPSVSPLGSRHRYALLTAD